MKQLLTLFILLLLLNGCSTKQVEENSNKAWENTKHTTNKAWDSTTDASSDFWDDTKDFFSDVWYEIKRPFINEDQ